MVVVQLSLDVIAEILSRLRVKDLIRFKSVCKAWLQLISSQEFIQLHLKRSSLRPIRLLKLDFDVDCCRLPSPDDPCGANFFSGSSCDGLVCVFNKRHGLIHIWNPAIRSSACIPIMKCPQQIRCFWFGRHNDEYKLLLGTLDLQIHLVRPYNINSGYDWKSTQRFIHGLCPCSDEIGTLCNGNVHWAVNKWQVIVPGNVMTNVWTILSYDLHQDKVGIIDIPIDKFFDRPRVRLGVVDGCLSAMFENHANEFELWAMKDYGLNKSWNKLIVLEAESAFLCRGVEPEQVVLDDPEMVKSPLYPKEVYVESLISPTLSLGSHMKHCQIY